LTHAAGLQDGLVSNGGQSETASQHSPPEVEDVLADDVAPLPHVDPPPVPVDDPWEVGLSPPPSPLVVASSTT
jgi:hypothetical protein